MQFRNRYEAGQQLAAILKGAKYENPLILAIPRGGVVVGAALASELGWPLDIVVTRKIAPPFNPELAVGAITATGKVILDDAKLRELGLTRQGLAREIDRQEHERQRRVTEYRGTADYGNLSRHTLVVVDDGIATGLTMRAALEGLAHEKPNALVVAVPVAPLQTLADLERVCDTVHCLRPAHHFLAVGQFYSDFQQVSDREVTALLKDIRRR